MKFDPSPLDELAAHVAAVSHCPSVSWGVVVDGRLVYHGSVGALDDGTAPTADTVYRIASMTKSFTAAAVLSLVNDGVLSLDQPIVDISADFASLRGPSTDSPPITLRHLMSMQSGLASDDSWGDRQLAISARDLTKLIAAGGTFAVAPGTAFEYSNYGYAIIGLVVERATGRRLQDLVDERLLRPLGMTRTGWHRPDHEDWARPYDEVDGAAEPSPAPVLADGGFAPMGGLWSTVADLAHWVSWFDDAYPARDGSDDPAAPRARRRLQQQVQTAGPTSRTAATGEGVDHVPERIDGGGYGLGLQVIHHIGMGAIVGHSGGLPGYGSNMYWLPGRRLGVVALANITYAPMRRMTRRMLELLVDQGLGGVEPLTASLQLAAAGRALTELVSHWDDGVARQLFADNVELDESFARRSVAVAHLGRLTFDSVRAVSAARGVVHAHAQDGAPVTFSVELSPQVPPLVQSYELEGVPDESV